MFLQKWPIFDVSTMPFPKSLNTGFLNVFDYSSILRCVTTVFNTTEYVLKIQSLDPNVVFVHPKTTTEMD